VYEDSQGRFINSLALSREAKRVYIATQATRSTIWMIRK